MKKKIKAKTKTKIVKKRRKNDCAICAVAMYLGESYEYVSRELKLCHDILHAGKNVNGATYTDSIEFMLSLHDIKIIHKANLKNVRKKALVTVKREEWDIGHMLYFDGKRVYESNRERDIFNTPKAKKYVIDVMFKNKS